MGKLNINASIKLKNLNNLATQVQNELDRVSKRVSLKIDKIDLSNVESSLSSLKKEIDKISQKVEFTPKLNSNNTESQIEKLSLRLQSKLNSAFEGKFIDTSYLNGLQDKLNGINVETPKIEIQKLTAEIIALGKTENQIVRLTKNIDDLEKNIKDIEGSKKIDLMSQEEITQLNLAKAQLEQLKNTKDQLVSGATKSSAQISSSINNANQSMNSFNDTINKSTTSASSLGKTFKNIFTYAVGGSIMYNLIGEVKQGINDIVDLDASMRDLRKVSSATSEELSKFTDVANGMAKNIGASTEAVIDATTYYSKLGYAIDEASQRAKNATMFSNVADMSIDDASKSLITIEKGFNLKTIEDQMRIMDVANEIGNKYSSTSEDVAVGLREMGNALYEAGSSYEQAVGIFVAGNASVQDASKVGNAIKTITMRLRGMETEIDETSIPVSKLRDEILQLTNDAGQAFDIMLDENTFKNPYEILTNLSKVYPKLSDGQRAYLQYVIAGQRQGNIFSGIMNNMTEGVNAYNTALNSTGSAEREQAVYMDSIQGKANAFKESLTGLWINLIDSNAIKSFIDGGTAIINTLDKIMDTFGALPTVMSLAFASFSAFKNNPITKMNSDIISTDKSLKNLVKGMFTLNTSTSVANGGLTILGVTFDVVKAKAMALQMAISAGIGFAIGALIQGITSVISKNVEWAKSSEKSTEIANELSNALKTINSDDASLSEYKKLNTDLKNANLTLEERESILKRISELKGSIGGQDKDIQAILDNENLSLETQMRLIEKINQDKVEAMATDLQDKMGGSYGSRRSEQQEIKLVNKELDEQVAKYRELESLMKNANGEDINWKGKVLSISEQQKALENYKNTITDMQKEIVDYNGKIKLIEESGIKAKYSTQEVSDETQRLINQFDEADRAINDSSGSVDGYGDSLNGLQGDIQTTADALKNMANEFGNLGNDIDILSKALEEFSENGIIGTDTMEKLLNTGDTQLISLLADENTFLEKGNELLSQKKSLREEAMNNAIDLAYNEINAKDAETQNFIDNENIKSEVASKTNKNISDGTADVVDNNKKNYSIDANNKLIAENNKLKSIGGFVNANAEATANMVNNLGNSYSKDVANFTNSINAKIDAMNAFGSQIGGYTYGGRAGGLGTSAKSSGLEDILGKQQLSDYQKQLNKVQSSYNQIYDSAKKVGIGDIGSSGSGGKGSGSSSVQKQQEDIESLTDRYYILQNALTDVENALKSLDTKMENATEEEKIKLLDQEIALLNKKKKALNDIWYEQKQEKNDLQYTLSQNGFQFDSEGNITNYKKRLNELLAWANSQSDAEAKKSAQDTYKNLVKIVDDYTKLIKDSIPDTINQFDDITNAIIDSQKEISDILQKQREEYVKNLEKETDALKNELQKRKDLINKQWKTEDEEDERAEKQDKINQLEADLASAIRTGDEALQKSIRDQLAEAQQELSKFIMKSERETINNRFDEEMNKLDEDLQNKIDMIESQLGDEDLLSLVQSGVRDLSSALNNIDSSTKNVNRSFAYVGDTVNNIGDIIGNTWGNNLDKVIEKAKEFVGILSSDLSLNTNNIPTTKTSNSGSTIQVDVGDINIQGLTKDEFNREWDKKGNEIYNEIMKQFNR